MKEKENLNIVFMGTPEFSVAILDALVEEGYKISAVITVPDKPAGRGQKLRESAVKQRAVELNLPILQPTNLKDEEFVQELKDLNPDLFIVVAFRMLPKIVWAIPPMGTFNLHASLLPQYRGAAPINWAIINGEKESGVTTFFIDEEIDTGKIILHQKMSISENETAGELHDRMMVVGAQTVVKTVEQIRKGEVHTIIQEGEDLKPAPKIQKADCLISFEQSTKEIHDFIRGMSPYPTAWLKLENIGNGQEKTLKIFRTSIAPHQGNSKIELFIQGGKLLLSTQDGVLYIEELQLEGKKRMEASAFILGFDVNDWKIRID